METVDDVVDEGDHVFLIKTDTQGYELGVLRGAKKLLSTGKVTFLLVEFSFFLMKQSKTDPFELLNFIYDAGFVCTYMAYHTRLKNATLFDDSFRYGVVAGYPVFTQKTVSFLTFVSSLETISHPDTAGKHGWTDLLCAHLGA